MRYSASEKREMIKLVEQSSLSGKSDPETVGYQQIDVL